MTLTSGKINEQELYDILKKDLKEPSFMVISLSKSDNGVLSSLQIIDPHLIMPIALGDASLVQAVLLDSQSAIGEAIEKCIKELSFLKQMSQTVPRKLND